MSLKDEPIPAGEEWYYELDGRAHGPMRWSDLEEMLSRAGETASQVRVRKGADGLWSAFRSGGKRIRRRPSVPNQPSDSNNRRSRGPWPPVVGAASRGASHRYSGSIATCRQLSEFGYS